MMRLVWQIKWQRTYLTIALLGVVGLASANTAIWQALKNGDHIVLLRHTETVPGIGDPANFKLNDCNTQRNLNDAGSTHARAWGKVFAANGVPVGGVFSSAWCRCVDTAKLAFGRVDTWPALNSHFESPQSASLQAEQVKGGIPTRMQKGKVLVLVTHQVNISAVSGLTSAMGEAVVMKLTGNALSVVGTLKVQ
jgi:broad specificity phosphatase PhoE